MFARRRETPGITVDPSARVPRNTHLEVWPGATLNLAAGCMIGRNVRLVVNRGHMEIGPAAAIRSDCTLIAHGEVVIGERALLEDGVVIVDFDHDIADVEAPIRRQGLIVGRVEVGADARIGLGAALLRDVTVGAGAVVAPHSVVTRSVQPGATVEGRPARPVVSASAR